MVVSIAVIKDFPAVSEVNELLTRDHARHNRSELEKKERKRGKKKGKKSGKEWKTWPRIRVEKNQSRRVKAELSR